MVTHYRTCTVILVACAIHASADLSIRRRSLLQWQAIGQSSGSTSEQSLSSIRPVSTGNLHVELLERSSTRDGKQHQFLSKGRQTQKPKIFEAEGQCPAQTVDALFKGFEAKYKEVNEWTTDTVMIVLMLVSLPLLFLGSKLVMPSLFIIVGGSVFLASFTLLKAVTSDCSLPVYAAAIAGVVAGLVAMKLTRVSFFIVGAVIGLILAYQVKAIVIDIAEKSYQSTVMKYYFVLAILVALLMGKFVHDAREDVFAFVTALIGAYGFEISLRAILLIFFEYSLSELASICVWAGAFILGFVHQWRSHHSAK